jgi:regulation of enolase protein 1 (concanavalin A-like superfamily)
MYKRLCFITCIIVFTFMANITLALETPVAYYPLDEGSGTTTGDASGNGHDGTIIGTVPWIEGAPGFGTGLDFPATAGNYVNCGTFNPSGSDDIMTVSAWFKCETLGGYQCIVGKAVETSTGTVHWQLTLNATGQVGWKLSGTAGYAAISTAVTAGEWYHTAMVKNGTNGELFLNGESAGTQTGLAAFPATGVEYPVMIGAVRSFLFNGVIDEVALFHAALSKEDIQAVMNGGLAVKGPATGSNPGNGAKDVPIDSTLSWKAGPFASTHNIFFSTSFDDVNDGTALVATGQAVDVNTYNPGIMEYATTYYWRVDEVNAPASPGTYTGKVWSFKTELEGYPLLPKSIINVTSFGDVYPDEPDRQDPNSTCTGLGLDANDMHSTGMKTMWLGTDEGAYLQYEFDKIYKFYDMLVWNYNEETPNNEYFGAKDVKVEYSLDGENWTEVNDVPEFTLASGDNKCIANTDVLLNGAVAKYVKLTFLTGWGDLGLYGISEVRFSAIPTYSSVPSPKTADKNIEVDAELSWKSGRGATAHNVYISTDETAVKEGTASSVTVTNASYSPSLNLGHVYYWRVDEVVDLSWTGDVWNFTTKEYNVIDNFEDYNDFTGHLVFEKWIGGDADPAYGGSQMGNTNAPFAERTIINSGKQAGPFYYNVSGTAETSLVARTFDTTLDLTVDGADTLSIYYRGNAVTYAQPESGVFALSAEGADIYGNTDEFKFVYKQLTGDGTIIARVDSIQNANAWSKAGVMIRNTLDANSVHATAVLAASNAANLNIVEFERRTEKGGTTTTTDFNNQYNPYWVKVTRSGSTLTAQLSPDGVNWRSFEADANNASTATIEMGATVYIGIVVTSHQANTLAAATFSGVQAIPGSGGKITGDWTVIAIGDTEMAEGTNTIDKMYVILEDSTGKNAKVYALANAVGSGDWMSWLIPYSQFTNVNMSKIKKITLGIGETGDSMNGHGLIYIDDIGYGHPLAK